jgi:undecaprenyl-diphosphatase
MEGVCFMDFVNAVILGIVEGVTEFLPISSTGHLILVEDYLPLGGTKAFADAFMVIIQLPAILAVVLYFWGRLWPFGKDKNPVPTIRLWFLIVAAFLPAAVLGFLLDKTIEKYLFTPPVVAAALIVGGVVLIVLEKIGLKHRFEKVEDFKFPSAVAVGFFQCLAMIPGTSRSAATIIGGMAMGAARPAAAEFSFFLAIPTMLGATALKVLKHGVSFSPHEWALLAVGSVVSFAVAYAVIAAFMRYIQTRSFIPFGWYRIVLGIIVILTLLF